MLNKTKEVMNAHEKENPHQKQLNNLAVDDLKSLGVVHPSKPFAMHVAYGLDGHHNNREKYKRNYDHGLSPQEKKLIDKETYDLAEIGAMLNNPEYIMDESHGKKSENQKHAKDVLQHLIGKHGPQESYQHISKELYGPLLQLYLDKANDDASILHEVLAPKMINESEHKEKDYSGLLKAYLIDPAFDGLTKGHWHKQIPNIHAAMQRGK